MEEIKSFVLYYDWYLLFKNFSLEEKGKILDTLFLYAMGKIKTEDVDSAIKTVIEFVSIYLDRDKEKYIKKCKKNAENIRKRYENRQKNKEKTNSAAAYDLDKFEKSLED